MDFITAPLITGIAFYFVYMTFELFVRRKERMAVIEKILTQNQPLFDPSVLKNPLSSLLPSILKQSFTSLKIGCLLIGLGLGLLVGVCINLCLIPEYNGDINNRYWEMKAHASAAYGASLMLFGGLGLLVAYLIERKARKKE